MRFRDYKHFLDYCLQVADNKKYIISIEERDSLIEFKNTYILLEDLSKNNIIEFRKKILSILAYYFDDGQIFNAFRYIKKINRSYSQFIQGELNIYDLINNLNNTIRMDIQFKEDYILSASRDSQYYPDRLDVYRILEDSFEVFTVKESDIDRRNLNKPGVFFIYNKDKELIYIGDSFDCILKSSFKFIDHNKIYDFSKLELYYTKTFSDSSIYKYYYVGKYKPILNGEESMEDDVTVQLDQLKLSKEYVRSRENTLIYNYEYFIKDSVHISEYLNKECKLYLYNRENKDFLFEKGINYKSIVKERLMKEAIVDAKSHNRIVATEYWK